MSRNAPLAVIVLGILIITAVLFLWFGHLKHEREQEMAYSTGQDEQTQSIQREADDFRIMNRNQQVGIAATGLLLVLVVVVWWVRRGRVSPGVNPGQQGEGWRT